MTNTMSILIIVIMSNIILLILMSINVSINNVAI